VLSLLMEAWNAYLELAPKSVRLQAVDDDLNDFRQGIHICQRIVMSRAMDTHL
jgi:hypothetical protein